MKTGAVSSSTYNPSSIANHTHYRSTNFPPMPNRWVGFTPIKVIQLAIIRATSKIWMREECASENRIFHRIVKNHFAIIYRNDPKMLILSTIQQNFSFLWFRSRRTRGPFYGAIRIPDVNTVYTVMRILCNDDILKGFIALNVPHAYIAYRKNIH